MNSHHVTQAGFGLVSNVLDPVAVTKTLGIEPTSSWTKGDDFNSHSGRQRRATGLWRLSTAKIVDDDEIQAHLEHLLRYLEPKSEEIYRIINEMSAVAHVNIWWNGASRTDGYSLPGSLVARLCTICQRIDLVFNCIDDENELRSPKDLPPIPAENSG